MLSSGKVGTTCGYEKAYFDSGDAKNFVCDRSVVPGKERCEFHDEDYWKEHPEEVVRSFGELVERCNEDGTELLCIGFHLPAIILDEVRGNAHFTFAIFHQRANFSGATFGGETYFSGATFGGETNFHDVRFAGKVDFTYAVFVIHLENLESETFPEIESKERRGVFFDFAKFEKPEEVIFDHTFLGQVSFINSDIKRVCFRNVWWREKDDRYILLDERMLIAKAQNNRFLDSPHLTDTNVKAVYNALRENYEYNLQYTEAGKFFTGGMEVRRTIKQTGKKREKTIPEEHPPDKITAKPETEENEASAKTPAPQKEKKSPEVPQIRFEYRYNNWAQRHFSIIEIYRLLCNYGESYIQPMTLILITILVFTDAKLVSFILEQANIKDILHTEAALTYPQWMKTLLVIRAALEASLQSFFFRTTPTGLDLIEQLMAIPLLGALIIALRRQFERRFRH